jgi:hypothetical protein
MPMLFPTRQAGSQEPAKVIVANAVTQIKLSLTLPHQVYFFNQAFGAIGHVKSMRSEKRR